jgi:hypothetical protein
VQQVRQHQARRSRADNADLSAKVHLGAPRSFFRVKSLSNGAISEWLR